MPLSRVSMLSNLKNIAYRAKDKRGRGQVTEVKEPVVRGIIKGSKSKLFNII